LHNTGSENVFLAKYDNTGSPLWAIGSSGKFNNVSFPLTADVSGNAIISGYFLSDTFVIGTDTLLRSLPIEIENAFIAKVGPTGSSLWASRPYSNGYTEIESVATDLSGNVYATGELISLGGTDYAVFGADTLYNDTDDYRSADIFLVKYDPNGHVLWAKSFGGSGFDRSYSVIVDNNNNVLMSGLTQSRSISFGTHTLTNPGGDICFVAKFDGNGDAKWVSATSPGNLDVGGGLTTDKWGNVFFAGSFYYDSVTIGSYTFYTDTPGNTMMFVAKTDSVGNVLWAHSIGYTDSIYGNVYSASLVADSLGNVLLTGGIYGYPSLVFGSDTLYDDTSNEYRNFFVMEYDAAGVPVWATTATGAGNFEGEGITADRSGNIFVIGSYNDAPISLGSYSLPVTRGGNAFIAKLSPPQISAVLTPQSQQQSINVYPVPSQSDVHVALAGVGYSAVRVTDMSGRTIWLTQCDVANANVTIAIPVSSLIPGSYIVTATHNGNSLSKTIVVRK
jgi:hypothetical protein